MTASLAELQKQLDALRLELALLPDASAAVAELNKAGQWTPVPRIAASATGITMSANVGWWVKAGRLVYGGFDFTLSSKGVGVGAFTVAGLPFTPAASSIVGFPACQMSGVSNCAGLSALSSTFVNGTIIDPRTQGAAGHTALTDANLTNTSRFIGTFAYPVAA